MPENLAAASAWTGSYGIRLTSPTMWMGLVTRQRDGPGYSHHSDHLADPLAGIGIDAGHIDQWGCIGDDR